MTTAAIALQPGPGGQRAAALPAPFTGLRLWQGTQIADATGPDEEACVLLLSGTFDLHGGPTHWGNRGSRPAPAAGRPVAVFLPPSTPFRAAGGPGEILVVTARRPAAPPATGLAAASQKPLLPLAGSGKAFDPTTGDWLPAEAFPDAAELLAPRRFEQIALPGLRAERVFARAYKATALLVTEAVLDPGATADLRQLAERPDAGGLLCLRPGAGCRLDAQPIAAAGLFAFDRAAPLVHNGTAPSWLLLVQPR